MRLVVSIGFGATLASGPGGGWAVVLLVTVEAVIVGAGNGVGDADYAVSRVSWELKNNIKDSFETIYL